MKKLQVLHLSGCGLIGSLPNFPSDNLILKDLSLSNNLFSGVIPYTIQSRNWLNLDLAFNNLGGNLISDFGNCTSLYLNNNYLSGLISQSLINLKSISILNGNIFSCTIINPNTLPLHDENLLHYNCGSNNFTFVFIIVIIILFIYAVFKTKIWNLVYIKEENQRYEKKFADIIQSLFLIQPYFNKDYFGLRSAGNRYVKYIEKDSIINDILNLKINLDLKKIKRSENSTTSNILLFCNFSDKILQHLIWLIFSLIFFWTPVSLILSSNYSLYDFNYFFSSSLIHLSGLYPYLILFIIFTLNLVLLNYILVKRFSIKDSIGKNLLKNKNQYFRVLSLVFVFIFDLVAVTFFNFAFIYSTFILGTIELLFVEVLVSLLKISWKWNVVPYLIMRIKSIFIPKSIISGEEEIIFQCG